jgi:hypothetical protein
MAGGAGDGRGFLELKAMEQGWIGPDTGCAAGLAGRAAGKTGT